MSAVAKKEWFHVDVNAKLVDVGSCSDYVSFEAGQKKYQNTACYAGIMGSLGSTDIKCFPNRKMTLPKEYFEEWFALCKQHHLVPDAVALESKEDQHSIVIPKGCDNWAHIYSALCCYRWMDSYPKMIWMIVNLARQNKASFFQLLHYGMAQHVMNTGHSLSAICIYENYIGHGLNYKSPRTGLLGTLIIKHFLHRDENGKSPSDGTCAGFLSRSHAAFIADTKFIVPDISGAAYAVPNLEALLWEEWSEIYTDKFNKAWFIEYFASVMKNRK